MVSTFFTLSHALLAVSFLASSDVATAGNNGFLATESGRRVGRDIVEQQLLMELSALLGHGTSHERLSRIEDAMRPMFKALPRNNDGGVDQGAARYALDRYFLTHHGWRVRGIAQDGESRSASSSTTMLKSRMPTFILESLEERVGRKQLGLGELAVLAATVEDLVHSDGLALLQMAYEAHNLTADEPLEDADQEDLIIRTFMLFFTMPWTQEGRNNSQKLERHLQKAQKQNPGWNDTMLWAEDLKKNAGYQVRGGHNPFSARAGYLGDYPSMVHFVEMLIDSFGLYQDMQCKELKNMLMDLGERERDDGRVPLAKFYGPFMQGVNNFFIERPAYLEQLGALDNGNITDLTRANVIVPNYIYGPHFCLASQNDFQSFCCVDHCNVLMESLERSIAHPVASPDLIAKLVAALPSDTVAAPRDLPSSLRQKLDLIAAQHGGHVPLHGRMFAQFMHHAFPNECPQPRALGATEAPMTHEEWRQSRNTTSVVSKKVMKQLMDHAAETADLADEEEAPLKWTDEEELLTSMDLTTFGSVGAQSQQSQRSALHSVMLLAAMCVVSVSTIAVFSESLRSFPGLSWPQGAKNDLACAGDLPRWASRKSHFV